MAHSYSNRFNACLLSLLLGTGQSMAASEEKTITNADVYAKAVELRRQTDPAEELALKDINLENCNVLRDTAQRIPDVLAIFTQSVQEFVKTGSINDDRGFHWRILGENRANNALKAIEPSLLKCDAQFPAPPVLK